MTITPRAKPSTFSKLISAVTRDGRMLPLQAIASKGLVSLALMVGVIFAAGMGVIFILSNPAIFAGLGGIAVATLYYRKYGVHLPPTVAQALEQRRTAREGNALPPRVATADRVPLSRSDRQLRR